MLKFHNLWFTGVKPYLDKPVNLKLGKPGIYMVRGRNMDDGGSNGSGKTQIFDTLSHILFDKTGKGSRKNSFTKKKFEGRVEISNQEHRYLITQYLNHPRFGNAKFVSRDGKEMTFARVAHAQAFIESEILGLDFEEFLGTIYLAQDNFPTMVYGLDSERNDFLSSLFDLLIYEDVQAAAKDEIGEIRDLINESPYTKQALIDIIDRIKKLKKDVEGNEGLEEEVKRLEKRIEDLEEKRDRLIDHAKNKATLKVLLAEKDELEPLIFESKHSIDNLKQILREYDDYLFLQDIYKRFGKVTKEGLKDFVRFEMLEKDVKKLRKELDGLPKETSGLGEEELALSIIYYTVLKVLAKRAEDGACVVCESESSSGSKKRKEFSSSLKKAMNEYVSGAVGIDVKAKKRILDEKIEQLRAISIDKDLLEHLPELLNLSNDVYAKAEEVLKKYPDKAKLERRVQKLEASEKAKAKLEVIDRKYREAKAFVSKNADLDSEEVEQIKDELKRFKAKLNEKLVKVGNVTQSKDMIDKLTRDKDEIVKHLSKREALEFKSDAYAIIDKAFSRGGLKQMKLNSISQGIAQYLPPYIKLFYPSGSFGVIVPKDSMNIKPVRYKESIDMKNLSGGEKKVLALCLLFTLRKMVMKQSSNLLILDEIWTSNLDGEKRDKLLSILSKDSGSTVFLTTNEVEVASQYFDGTYCAVRKSGVSNLIKEA